MTRPRILLALLIAAGLSLLAYAASMAPAVPPPGPVVAYDAAVAPVGAEMPGNPSVGTPVSEASDEPTLTPELP